MLRRRAKGLLAILLIFTIMAIGSVNSYAFGFDIVNHWAKGDIIYLLEKGAIKGYPDGSFRPDETITRAEFLTIVNSIFGYMEESDIFFTDVKESSWFYKDVKRAVKAGYIKGYEDGTIRKKGTAEGQQGRFSLSQ